MTHTTYPSSAVAPTGKVIEIAVRGREASVAPDAAALVEPLLMVSLHVALAGGNVGYEVTTSDEPLSMRSPDGELVFPAGLVPRVVAELERAGHEVRVLDRTLWMPEPAPDLEMLEHPDTCAEERELLRKLTRSQFGQILYRTSLEQAAIIASIADFLPTARILVVTCARQDGRPLARKIRKYVERPREVQSHAQQPWHSSNRCLVETASKFAILCVPDAWDVIIFADWRAAIMPTSLRTLVGFLANCRVYALVPAGQPMDDVQRLQLELAAGGVLYTMPSARQEQIPTQVVMVTPPGTPMRTAGLSALDRKRMLFWHNKLRNRAIVEIAYALAAGSHEALWAHGVFLPEYSANSSKARKRSVVIYTEALEHARELKQLLREQCGSDLGAKQQRDPTKKSLRGTKRGVKIVTLTQVLDKGLTADVLVRADGTADPLPLLNWQPAREGQSRLVVDFRDDGDGQALRDCARRLAEYEAAGWIRLGTDTRPPRYSPEIRQGEEVGNAPRSREAIRIRPTKAEKEITGNRRAGKEESMKS